MRELDPSREYERERLRAWRKKNKLKVQEYSRVYIEANKEKIAAYKHKYWLQNQKELSSKRTQWSNNKYKSDPVFKLKRLIRNRVRAAIKGKGYGTAAFRYLGCSIEDFKSQIESLWQTGMNWDNYSLRGWHIDHIIPLSAFNLQDPEQQRKAFHFSNLRPLWALDNLKKNKSFDASKHVEPACFLGKQEIPIL